MKMIETALSKLPEAESLDFDAFVFVLDHCRLALVEMRRTHAFFTEEEIKKYRTAFYAYDDDHSGDIKKMELSKLMRDLGIPLGTKQDQHDMFVKMDIARQKARAAGVEESLVGDDGSPSLKFAPFLFLLRMLQRVSDVSEVDRDAMMEHITKFTQAEITEFREIFAFWAEKVASLEKAHNMVSDKADDGNPALTKLLCKDGVDESIRNLSLSQDGMLRVVRSLGVKPNDDEKRTLLDKLNSLPRANAKKYEFFEFLQMMRWMLDINFADIGAVLRGEG